MFEVRRPDIEVVREIWKNTLIIDVAILGSVRVKAKKNENNESNL